VERADVTLVAGRALEVIAISADLKARALPAIDAWIRADDGCARAFWERCLAWTFRIAMADKLSGARRIFHHG
jgi:hypothetical protein